MTNKSRIIFAVIGFIIFSFGMEAWGADWKFIRKDAQGGVWEIDVASISHQPNNIVRVWVKATNSQKSKTDSLKQVDKEYKDVSYSIRLHEFHCTEKKARLLSVTRYSLDGEYISSFPSTTEWQFVISDSLGMTMLEAACK